MLAILAVQEPQQRSFPLALFAIWFPVPVIDAMTVSAIIPARNEEATIAAAVESLAAQPEVTEIIAINDQSTDATASLLAKLANLIPQFHVLETVAIPPGWVGKNYAVSLGAERATGDWLLFTDADGVHMRGSTAHALNDAAAFGAGLVSYSPEQETVTWWEKAIIPFVYTRLGQKFSYDAVNDPASTLAAASGQYLMIRREDYARVGGHAAVAQEVLEDVALARLAKQKGIRLHFGSGEGIIRVRMYRTFAAMWDGWTKNLYPLMSGPSPASRQRAEAEAGGADAKVAKAAGGQKRGVGRELSTVIPWVPLVSLLLTPLHLIWGVLALVLLAGRHAAYAASLRRNRFPAGLAIYYLPGVALYSAVLLASEWRYARGRVDWKGRSYPVNREN